MSPPAKAVLISGYLLVNRDDRQAAICGNKHKEDEIRKAAKVEAQQ